MRNTVKHAVICSVESGGAIYLGWLKSEQGQKEEFGFKLLSRDPLSFEQLLEIAVGEPFSHFWIHASAGIDPTEEYCKFDCSGQFTRYDDPGWDIWLQINGRKRAYSAHGFRLPKGGQKMIDIIFADQTRWGKTNKGDSAWAATCSPKQMLVVLDYLSRGTGVTIGASPASVGWAMIAALHPEEVADIPREKLAEMHFDKSAAFDLVDQRPLTDEDRRGRYLLKFDRNSAYLSACQKEAYGRGTPRQTTQWDEKAVGVWRVTLHATSDAAPFLKFLGWHGTRWLATPLVRLQLALGFEIEIHEGYVFTQRFQLLSSWAAKVWELRQSYNLAGDRWAAPRARAMAAEAMKQIAVSTIGIAGYHGFSEEENSMKHRPDVRLATIARTYELIYHNILKAQRLDGKLPIMVATDALYYCCSTNDPYIELTCLLGRAGKLGGYKYEGCIEITPDVLAVLEVTETSVAKKLEILNRSGWVK